MLHCSMTEINKDRGVAELRIHKQELEKITKQMGYNSAMSLTSDIMELDQIPSNRGLSQSTIGEIVRFIRWNPQGAEMVLEKLTKHFPGMGEQNFGRIMREIAGVRKDLVPLLPLNVYPGPGMMNQLTKLANIEPVVDMFFLCRERLEEIGTAQHVEQFEQLSARRAIIRAISLPLETDLLETLLAMPGGKDIQVRIHEETYDWVSGLARQNLRQVATKERNLVALNLMGQYGVPPQPEGHPCRALSILAEEAKLRAGACYDLFDHLLTMGANWQGLGLENNLGVWPIIQSNIMVKKRMLEGVASKVRPSEDISAVKRPAM